jgi:hypothetical protein
VLRSPRLPSVCIDAEDGQLSLVRCNGCFSGDNLVVRRAVRRRLSVSGLGCSGCVLGQGHGSAAAAAAAAAAAGVVASSWGLRVSRQMLPVALIPRIHNTVTWSSRCTGNCWYFTAASSGCGAAHSRAAVGCQQRQQQQQQYEHVSRVHVPAGLQLRMHCCRVIAPGALVVCPNSLKPGS